MLCLIFYHIYFVPFTAKVNIGLVILVIFGGLCLLISSLSYIFLLLQWLFLEPLFLCLRQGYRQQHSFVGNGHDYTTLLMSLFRSM